MVHLDHGNVRRLVIAIRVIGLGSIDLVLLEHGFDLRHAWPTLVLFVQQLLGVHERVIIRLVEALRQIVFRWSVSNGVTLSSQLLFVIVARSALFAVLRARCQGWNRQTYATLALLDALLVPEQGYLTPAKLIAGLLQVQPLLLDIHTGWGSTA